MSLEAISAEIEAAGDSSIRVMEPCALTSSTVATVSSGALTTVPTGSWRRSSTDVTLAGSAWTKTSTASPLWPITIRVAVVPTSAARTSWATWAAVRPTAIALFGSGVTWISGVPLDRSDLRLRRSVLSARAAITASLPFATSAASSPETMTLRLFDVNPAACETATSKPSVLTGASESSRTLEYAVRSTSSSQDDRDPGAVGRAAALGGDDGLEPGVALARDGRLDEHDLRVGDEDLLGLARPLQDGGRAGAGRRRDRDLAGSSRSPR